MNWTNSQLMNPYETPNPRNDQVQDSGGHFQEPFLLPLPILGFQPMGLMVFRTKSQHHWLGPANSCAVLIFLCFSPVFLVLLVCWCLLASIRAPFPHQMSLLKRDKCRLNLRKIISRICFWDPNKVSFPKNDTKSLYIFLVLFPVSQKTCWIMLDHVGLPSGKAEPSASWTSRWRASQRLKLESEFSRITAPIFGEKANKY
jgi:hypothetical protein